MHEKEQKQADPKQTRLERIIRLVIGSVLFCGIAYFNFVEGKDVPVWLYGIPGFLIGLDPREWLSKK